jgi:hypothetical protein
MPKQSVLERLMSRVEKTTDGCWLWTGQKLRDGYGKIRAYGSTRLTHRVAYQEIKGSVPADLDLDHLCRNRACCNPDHLEPVTHAVNCARSMQARLPVCPKGHEYSVRPEKRRKRVCIACSNARNLRGYYANRDAINTKRRAKYAVDREQATSR